MSDHLPECRLHGPCPVTESDHVIRKAALRDVCFECEEECVCGPLRACERRVTERIRTGVTGLPLDNSGRVDYADLLAVIDALKEGEPDVR